MTPVAAARAEAEADWMAALTVAETEAARLEGEAMGMVKAAEAWAVAAEEASVGSPDCPTAQPEEDLDAATVAARLGAAREAAREGVTEVAGTEGVTEDARVVVAPSEHAQIRWR